MPENYILLERTELNASAASVTFANIPQTGYTDLKIVATARGTTNGGALFARFNSSSTGYSTKQLFGDGASVGSGSGGGGTSYVDCGIMGQSTDTANTFSNQEIYIPNYTSSNNKSVSVDSVNENNATGAYAILNAVLWSNSAAINSVTFTPQNGPSFVAGSTFSLYGIAAFGTTPAIAPKASGGNVIATDGTYWYHAFLSSGSFVPQVGLSCDVLVVAGGGGGGGNGGGGGAGGLLGFTSQAISTSQNVTVGAGGLGGNTSAQATRGTDSSFGVLTAAVGGGDGNTQSSAWTFGTGGSGGGGGSGISTGRAGTTGQGNSGGNATIASPFPNGGGGGAGGVGGNGSGSTAGNGGIGATNGTTVGGTAGPYTFINAMGAATNTGQLSGGNYYYAGGGGGCVNSGTAGTGGLGGGGNGTGTLSGGAAPSGTTNTGGGGGGGGGTGTSPATIGGNGGSGIIIVRYPIA